MLCNLRRHRANEGAALDAGHEVMVRLCNQVTSYDNLFHAGAPRIDLSGARPLHRRVIVGLGVAAVSGSGDRVDVDGRASVTLRF